MFLFLLCKWVGLLCEQNYRVSTRERSKLKEGDELCRQGAGRIAEDIQNCALAGAAGEEKTC